MRKRIGSLLLLIALLSMCVFGSGCTVLSCSHCVDASFWDCIACVVEAPGCVNGVCWDSMFGYRDECVECMSIAPWYMCGGCIRTCGNDDCMMCTNVSEDMEVLSEEDYAVEFVLDKRDADYLDSYYVINVKILVRAYVPLKDVVVRFRLTDSNGNRLNDAYLYIAEEVEVGSNNRKSAEASFFFAYETKEQRFENREDYTVEADVIAVYGRS
ncbi:MAG: hypothetical protein J6D21_08265 [Clostridia bacterium]|nr:hypothetical protein [Clostridia bacterium]